MHKQLLIYICSAIIAASVSAGEIDDINSEISKIGAEMITLGGDTKESMEELEYKFASGKYDTPEMKVLRKAILARRLTMIKDSSEAMEKYRALPEIAAKYASLPEDGNAAKKIISEIAADYDSGKFDTEDLKKLKEKVSESEKFISEKTAELRKMFDALPQFSEPNEKIDSAHKRLRELAARRDELLKKRQELTK